jgi:hypothetical protein
MDSPYLRELELTIASPNSATDVPIAHDALSTELSKSPTVPSNQKRTPRPAATPALIASKYEPTYKGGRGCSVSTGSLLRRTPAAMSKIKTTAPPTKTHTATGSVVVSTDSTLAHIGREV